MGVFADSKQLVHPYYIINVLMSLSFMASKFVPSICEYVFVAAECGEMSMWESEVYFFMVVIVMFRTRKSGSRNMLAYISTAAMYAKICNVILWFSADPVYGFLYILVAIAHFLVIGEPVYKGPEKVVYFQGKAMDEELQRDRNCIWIITFFTAWSPSSSNLAPIFAKLSAEYTLDNLKFGKIDVGRYADAAKHYHINDTAFSLQLPTISVFKDGKELERRPCLDAKQKFQKFYFTEDNIKAAFDLNNLYMECKKVLEEKYGKKEEKDGKKEGHLKSE